MARGMKRSELAAQPGLSAPLLDYWARTGLLEPDQPGDRYSDTGTALALVLADAAALGAPGVVLAGLAAELRPIAPLSWPRALWIDIDGVIHSAEPERPAWLLHPLERGCDQVSLALAS